MARGLKLLLACVALGVPACAPALAEKISGTTAVFAALDKVTARIQPVEIGIGRTTAFGTLRITPRVCYARPPTEPPQTSTFLEIDDVQVDGTVKRIFTGWMFAESPGLHAVEHPVFDLWLTGCRSAAPSVAVPQSALPAASPPRQRPTQRAQQPPVTNGASPLPR